MRCFALGLLAVLATSTAMVQAAEQHGVELPDQLTWQPGPGLPPGGQVAVLYGDPNAKGGDLVLRFKAPAGYHIPPHTHPAAESLTVISGSMQHGMASPDRNQAAAMPTGSYIYLPANNPHTVWAGDQGVVLDVHTTAPFRITYLNPADDPRKEQASTTR